MGEHDISSESDEARFRQFTKALIADITALERMLDNDLIESSVRRIGAEQEMFIVDATGRPATIALAVLDRLNDEVFTTELALFNLEANLEPLEFGGDCLRAMERQLDGILRRTRAAAAEDDCSIVLMGILPTLEKTHLGLDHMTPRPRYRALNRALTELSGGGFHCRIKGIDELDTTHDNVMLESCNTSFQIHFQVGANEFARLYNLAQAITAPVLAAAVNSPLLLGRRLWHETRVALFQQSLDERSRGQQARGHRTRVSFGEAWVEKSVLEIFREDAARFRILLAADADEDPLAVIARGERPNLNALRLHNGTVYRWNRACYGTKDGVSHLRIENRVLPSGPSVVDEVANAAFFFGLMAALADEYGDISKVMRFAQAKDNFLSASRHGLRAQFTWIGGREYTAQELILDHLLPLARLGLRAHGIDAADRDRYLGVLEDRVRAGRTGAQWLLDSLDAMGASGTSDQRRRSLTRAVVDRQETGAPVHEWELASLDESGSSHLSYQKVGHIMTTDLFTVRPGDVVDLAASVMDWRHVRHVPVENRDGNLVGLVSHRALLRLVSQGIGGEPTAHVTAADIMKTDVVTVTAETPTLESIELMREHRIGCLPVVDGRRLVGIVTEWDLAQVALTLLEKQLRDSLAP
jgi:CBS domain-containing protein/gamma-glutamyl:cysteine ligase YbdK (ATP-grasp superfamily)